MTDRFYIDCEFDGHGGPLLSIAMVRENGASIHVRTMDAEVRDPWVIANVVPLLGKHEAGQHISTFTDNVGSVLRRFIGDSAAPVIIADSPVDIGRFCAAISTSPEGLWASSDYSRMTFEVHNVDCYPTDLPGAVQHNAWWDAMALRRVLESLTPRPQTDIPLDIAEAVVRMGEAEWGALGAKPDADHAAEFADSLRITREHFGLEGDRELHGLYLKGTATVLCHTGTSPNSAINAQALTGAWNWLLDQSQAALASSEAPQDRQVELLRSIREPSSFMLQAGWRVRVHAADPLGDQYRAMIDARIEELTAPQDGASQEDGRP